MSRMVIEVVFVIFSALLAFHIVDGGSCIKVKGDGAILYYNCIGKGLTQIPKEPLEKYTFRRLYLQNNLIEILKVGSFVNWSTIFLLKLDNNPLKTIEEGAFRPLLSIRKMHLSKTRLVINEGLTSKVFKPIPSLRKLFMEGCSLKVIPHNFFKYLPNLDYLNISHQKSGLKFGKSPFNINTKLEELEIRGNELRSLSENVIPRSVKELFIDSNSWFCDCHLRWILKIRSVIKDNPVCAGPTSVIGRPIRDLQRDDFQCKPEIKSKSMDKSVNATDTISLFCNFYSDPRGTESWLKDGAPLDHNSTRILIHPWTNGSVTGKMEIEIKNVTSNDAGEWECQVGNKAGNASAIIHIIVLQPAGIFTGLAIGILCFCVVSAIGLYMFIRHRRGNFGDSEGGHLIPLPQR